MVKLEMLVDGLPDFGVDVPTPTMPRWPGPWVSMRIRVTDPAEIEAAYRAALCPPGPVAVELITDPKALSLPPKITGAADPGLRHGHVQGGAQPGRRRGRQHGTEQPAQHPAALSRQRIRRNAVVDHLPGARCPVPGARCPVPGARCPALRTTAGAGYGTSAPGAGGPPSSLDGAPGAATAGPRYWALSANLSCRIVPATPAMNVAASTA